MNIGEKWSIEEEKLLLYELVSGRSIPDIASCHGRTVGGISSRRCHIAVRFYRDGMPEDEIMKWCRITKLGLMMLLKNRGLK